MLNNDSDILVPGGVGSPGWLCGVDEAGRGPLAGPVYAAAVIFSDAPPAGLADSKKLSAKRREALYESILSCCHVGVGVASAAEIDAMNILQATFEAMRRAVANLPCKPGLVVVDGNRAPAFEGLEPAQVQTMVKGDALCAQVSAASIVAKVLRDRAMAQLEAHFPGYGFARHAGYGVAAHMQALQRLGPCVEHRMSFAPVARAALQRREAPN